MTVRCIDVETTGIDPARDAITEIASVDMQRDGTITNRKTTLVAPGIPVPPEASAVHHLIDGDLAAAPRLQEVIEPFKGADAYVAHNCSFERSFLDRHLGEETIWVCTYKCALRVWPDLPSHGNQALRYQFGLINPFDMDRATLTPHRALANAIVTAAVFFELVKHATWPQLVQWSYEPALQTYLRFRMHRGERFDAVPEDYLQWMAEGNHDLSNDVRFSARHWLSRKECRLATATAPRWPLFQSLVGLSATREIRGATTRRT
jgi:exodeoxyribonuclease X